MDRINYLDTKLLNNYPPIEWFYNKRPNLSEVRALAEMFPPVDEISMGTPKNFVDWFMVEVMGNENVRQRIIKNANKAGDQWDHDWSTTITSTADSATARILLSVDDAQSPPMALTAYPNMTSGHLTYITDLARYSDRYENKDELKKEVIRHLGMVSTYNSILTGAAKAPENANGFYSLNEHQLKESPRIDTKSALYFSDRPLTVQEILESQNEIIRSALPPDDDTFSFLKVGYDIDQNLKKVVEKLTTRFPGVIKNPKSIHCGGDLLKYMDVFFERAIEENPDNLERVLQKAREVFARHHQKKDDRPPIDDTRGKNWRQFSQETTGLDPNRSYGMYQ